MESLTSPENATNTALESLNISPNADQNMGNNDSAILLPIFPPEVITEIFTHMLVTSLPQVRLVCKQWREIIDDYYFMKKYMNHARIAYHWYNVSGTSRDANTSSPDRNFQPSYLHGLDGLIMLKNIPTKKVFVWNPVTRRVLELPDTHHDYQYGYALSYIPATNKYKIVSVCMDRESGKTCCEVFTPDQDSESWRCLPFPDTVDPQWNKRSKTVSVISSGGVVHCHLKVKVDDATFEDIISLDSGTESFVVHSVPKSFFEDWKNVSALDWYGKLGFAYVNGENIEVMELEDYKDQQQIRWCKEKKVIHLPFVKKNGYESSNLVPLLAETGVMWFCLVDGKKLISYTMETGGIDVIQSRDFAFRDKLHPYKPSWVNFETMKPDYPELEKYRPCFLK